MVHVHDVHVHESCMCTLSQSERVREAVRRLLSSDKSDCWILNTAFTVDEFSFVESQLVGLYSQVINVSCKIACACAVYTRTL